ncbi:Lon protease family protein [Hoeflea sp. TYP-13]|uniref:Lon protease family protein n=1 Tax=Hoeflea sp. TYP-13 TaxID=3230023 RepID=UPI0034C6DBD9
MTEIQPLSADVLRQRCDPQRLDFETTADIPSTDRLMGQGRAADAMRFALAMRRSGYNLFVIGERGFGHQTSVKQFLEYQAADSEAPDEWVYVNNFDVSRTPKVLRLPPGNAVRFREAMEELIDDLKVALPSLFETDDYRNRLRAINDEAKEQQDQAFETLRTKAAAEEIAILRTPMGFAFAPTKDDKVVEPEIFNALDKTERERVEGVIEGLQHELESVLRNMPVIEKKRRDSIRSLNAELASSTVSASVASTAEQFRDIPPVLDYLKSAEADLVRNAGLFLQDGGEDETAKLLSREAPEARDPRFRRYGVNVVVANGDANGAAVILEDHPTLGNLLGRIEHLSQMGTLVTDFMLIKPGSLHKANGGFIVIEARKILTEPFAWEALKRTLRGNAIRIESAAEQIGFATTVTLDPEPIPLDVKVILIGERRLYDLLVHLDPEFSALFKVEADFEDRWARTSENEEKSVQLFSSIIDDEDLRPLDATGAALLIEEVSRFAGDAERLSLHIGYVTDLLREADFWAGDDKKQTIGSADVERAIAGRIKRKDRVRERVYEAIDRETLLIDTAGTAIGQVNGLAVTGIGDFVFGKPSRITARVRMGTGKLVDIEREVELGGPLHSKGVLILTSFLNANFALDRPLSLWASLVFEQSYGGIDGDSASSAELYALLSALAEVPIRQDLAVTGSVNQLGQVQAIGGVNEKIEGFFDICNRRGLTGDQGVLIPKSNTKHLMLRQDVVDAVKAGKFAVYPIHSIDEGIEILTGLPAGVRDTSGKYPAKSIYGLVDDRLREFAEARRAFAERENGGKDNG